MKQDLGELLLEEGILGPDEMKELRQLQQKTGRKLEELILKKGSTDEPTLLLMVARQYGLEYREKLEYKEDPLFQSIPNSFIHKSRLLPLYREGDRVTVVTPDPSDLHPMDDIRTLLSPLKVSFVLATEAEIARIIHSHFDETAHATREVMEGLTAEEFAELDQLSDDTMDLANEAPIIRMVNAIFAQGVQERASDIHVEPYEKQTLIRYRIDGILHKRLSPPRALHAGIISRIKIMANLNIAENRLPQDGRIKRNVAGKEVDIRVSTIPTRYGERAVMRLLNKSDVSFEMDNLGMDPSMLEAIRKNIKSPNGIILVTGPTGSGKTTTLYSFLKELNEESRNILTAEDPVEYEVEGVSQMQIHEKVGLTFAASLRAMLRQDPDIIMVGEIRDEETARIAIQASLTGHLVLSTLHTNDAPSAVTRLVDMGIEPYLITSTVRLVMAQRLVRVVCPHCKTSYKPTSEELAELEILPDDLPDGVLYYGKGCDRCVQSGYLGRMAIYELFLLDNAVQQAVLKGVDATTLKDLAYHRGMVSLARDGKRLVIKGLTTIEEVMRVT